MKKRTLYPFLVTVSIAIAIVFALWKLSTTDAPEVKTVYRVTVPKSASNESSTPQKTETSLPNFVDKDGDNERTLVDVTDPNLSISHPRNVEARLKVIIDRQKSWQTPEHLAKPEVKRFYDIIESEAYLDLINNGATFNDMINFLADEGLPISRDLMLQSFREHFPKGDPSDYEPEMRQKLTALIRENGGYDNEVLDKFMGDERASAWYSAHFGRNFSLRDMNLDEAIYWLKDVKTRAMQSTEIFGPSAPEAVATSEKSPADTSSVNTSDPMRNPQGLFTRNEKGNVPEDTNELLDITIHPPAVLGESGFKSMKEKNIETALREHFSPERFNRALQTLNQYGPEEGLRRLKESDPEVAKQIERLLPKR